MGSVGSIVTIFTALAAAAPAPAAELPAHARKSKPIEAARKCNIAGVPGVLASNNVCMKMSGYISAGFTARQIK
jgi:hypothetical protein